jgi:hypothetical protein
MKRKLFSLFAGLFSIALILSLGAVDASAQKRKRESRNRLLSKAQVETIIDRVEDRVDNFVKNYDKSLDRSKLNGTSREDWLLGRARDLERTTDELRSEFDRNDAWAENKEEVRRCLNIATDIDRNMRNYRYGSATETNWSRVRYELNTLADVYNLPKVGANVYK